MEDNNKEMLSEEINETKTEKKGFVGNIKAALSKMVTGLIRVFKDYPLTMGAIVIASIIAAILIEYEGESEFLAKAGLFFGIFSLQSIFSEEHFRKKIIHYIITEAVAAGLAVLFVAVISTEQETLFGMNILILQNYLIRFYVVWLSGLVVAALYHMFKRSGDTFERYCIDTFCSFVRVSVVYGLLAGGIAIIVAIFNYLIVDTHYFLGRLEIFLAGGIYVPACILCFSQKQEMYGKFSRLVFLYVLEPMLMIADVIIYAYIIKILFGREWPSNEVFAILTFLFCAGLFIWTMCGGIDEENNFFVKVSKKLPFVFAPFIILQAICIGMRIGQYGITPDRYMGMMLIAAEVIYIAVYTIQIIKKKNVVSCMLYVGVALLFIGVLMPGLNCFDMTFNSQYAKIRELLDKGDKIKDSDKKELASRCNVIRKLDMISEEKLNSLLSKDEKKLIDEITSYSYYGTYYRTYISDYESLGLVDVSEYSSMAPFSCYYPDDTRDVSEYSQTLFDVTMDNYIEDKYFDIAEILEGWMDDYTDNTSEFDVNGIVYHLDDHTDMRITNVYMTYNSDDKTIEYLNLSGFLFFK